MPSVCFYFQVHQPFRLRRYASSTSGAATTTSTTALDEAIVRKVAARCYLPMNAAPARAGRATCGRFRCAFSISGAALDQMERWAPEVIESFQALARTGCVEFLGETYYHSSRSSRRPTSSPPRSTRHGAKVERAVRRAPDGVPQHGARSTQTRSRRTLRARLRGVLAEGRRRTCSDGGAQLRLRRAQALRTRACCCKNYRLSDDIAFRFSNRGWEGSADGREVRGLGPRGERLRRAREPVHGLRDVRRAPVGGDGHLRVPARPARRVLDHADGAFLTPTEAIARYAPVAELSFPHFTSWADAERDLTRVARQRDAGHRASTLYELRDAVMECRRRRPARGLAAAHHQRPLLLHVHQVLRRRRRAQVLQPVRVALRAHINFMNVLADLELRARA